MEDFYSIQASLYYSKNYLFDYGLLFLENHLDNRNYIHTAGGRTPHAESTLYRFLLIYYFSSFSNLSCLSRYFYYIAFLFSRNYRSLLSLTTDGYGSFLVGLQLFIPPLISYIFNFYYFYYY